MAKRFEGSVRELPSGNFQVRYFVDGIRHPGGTFGTAKQAEMALRRLLTEVESGDWFDTSKGNVTFEEFSVEYLKARKGDVKDSTYRGWLSLLSTMLLPTFGTMTLNKISVRTVDQWWSAHNKKLVNRRNAYFLLRSMLRYAVRWKSLKESPCDVEGAGKDVSKPHPTFELAHFEKVLEHIPQRLHVVLWTAYAGSLRISELTGLDRGHYDASTGLLSIVQQESITSRTLTETKTGNTRDVFLYGPALDLLSEYLKDHPALPKAPLFTGEKGGRIDRNSIRKEWNSARVKAGIPEIHLHDLRHISLTRWSRLPGVNTKDVMERGGHRTSAAALRYQHSDQSRAQQLAQLAEQELTAANG